MRLESLWEFGLPNDNMKSSYTGMRRPRSIFNDAPIGMAVYREPVDIRQLRWAGTRCDGMRWGGGRGRSPAAVAPSGLPSEASPHDGALFGRCQAGSGSFPDSQSLIPKPRSPIPDSQSQTPMPVLRTPRLP